MLSNHLILWLPSLFYHLSSIRSIITFLINVFWCMSNNMLRETQFYWFYMDLQFMFRCGNFIYLFFLIGNKLISAFAASARSSEFGLRSGQSPIQLITNHHLHLVLCSMAGSNDLALQHCSVTCFPFHSRVCFIFFLTLKHHSSSLFSPLSHKK